LQIPEQQKILLELDVALRETLERLWDTHKEGIGDWKHCKRMMLIRFGIGEIMHNNKGMISLTDHVVHCMTTWRHMPNQEWMHRFIHTLETVPKNWYLEIEVCRGTTD
jgi:hypothetical protein